MEKRRAERTSFMYGIGPLNFEKKLPLWGRLGHDFISPKATEAFVNLFSVFHYPKQHWDEVISFAEKVAWALVDDKSSYTHRCR